MKAWFPLCTIALLGLPLGFALQEPQIRVDVEAVNVFVSVTDKNGHFITDLGPEDFVVYEDGRVQEITNFSRETNMPLHMGLLVDTSSSVRLKLDFEKSAARNFLYSVMRPQDRALLVEFDRGVTLLQDFTSNPSALVRELETLRAGGGTSLLDAIYEVTRDKMTADDVRKLLVVLSDGRDLNSSYSEEEALEMTQHSDVAVYAIGTTRIGADEDHGGREMLEQLAEETGGRAFFPYSAHQLEEAFAQIDEELRSQYSLTYVPTNTARDGSYRRIKVNVRTPEGATVHHKQGYFAPRPGS